MPVGFTIWLPRLLCPGFWMIPVSSQLSSFVSKLLCLCTHPSALTVSIHQLHSSLHLFAPLPGFSIIPCSDVKPRSPASLLPLKASHFLLTALNVSHDSLDPSRTAIILTPRWIASHYLSLSLSPSPYLLRGRAPRLGQHQRVALLAGVWRGLGDRAALLLAPRDGRRHHHRGQGLQGRHHAGRDQEAALRPLHVRGQQQAGLQLCHVHCRCDSVLLLFLCLMENAE